VVSFMDSSSGDAQVPDFFSDSEIAALLREPKLLPADYAKKMAVKPKRGHSESELDLSGEDGSEFRIIRRRSHFNPLDFSVILAYRIPASNQIFRLRRYNGRSHDHTNPLEGETFYDFHIHMATERYQRTGNREDTYAETTDRYSDMDGALACLLADCGFVAPPPSPGTQRDLFPM
jgi:hypothetical protein